MKSSRISQAEVEKILPEKTKKQIFVETVDHLVVKDGGVLVHLDDETSPQNFRNVITRHYRDTGEHRGFMMKQTLHGLLVTRVK